MPPASQVPAPDDISTLVRRWSAGDRDALERLVPIVEATVRQIAAAHVRRAAPDHILTTTVLVQEAYLRVMEHKLEFQDRAHFFAVCARVMRGIVIDWERARLADKRGGGAIHVQVEACGVFVPDRTHDLLAIHDALERLAEIDPRKSRLVELRFYGGLTVEECAEVLGISKETVAREWRLARMWLRRFLKTP